MLSLEKFKNKYKNEINDYNLTEEEIVYYYNIYLEDPFQFGGDMICP